MANEQEEEQESPLEKGAEEASRFAIKKGVPKLIGGSVGSALGGPVGTFVGAAVASVAAKFSKYIILAVVGAILIVVFLIAIILSALGIIGGGALDFGSPGGGLGIKDDYCQAYRSPEDLDGDGELDDCSAALKGFVLEAAAAAKMPAAVLIAIGLNEDLGAVMVLSEAEITQYSEAGAELPGDLCDTSSAGAKGPMQFIPETFDGHKSFIIDAGKRPDGYEPKICNIADNIYAAAHKLKSDAIDPVDEPAREWTEDEIIVAASSYLFGSPRTLLVCDAEDDYYYCTKVLNFYEDKKDQGVLGDPNSPQGRCPIDGTFTSGFRTDHRPNHDGIDMQSDLAYSNWTTRSDYEERIIGDTVYSTITGRAEFVGPMGGSGNVVEIKNDQYKVRFAHLLDGSFLVSQGQNVSAGQPIGTENHTGRSTATHLHYEIFDSTGSNIDPQPFLPWRDRGGVLYCERGAEGEAVVGSLFEFEAEGDWSESDKDKLARAISVPIRSETWKRIVFGAGKVTLVKGSVDCPICSGVVNAGVLTLRPFFFEGLTDQGRVFVITHELTHVLRYRDEVNNDAEIYERFLTSEARRLEYNLAGGGVIRSYPLCEDKRCAGVDPLDEDFAEMAGNYVTDRDPYDSNDYHDEDYNGSLDFPSEYPKHFEFAREFLFGGTTF